MLLFKKSDEKTVVNNDVYTIRDLNLYDSKGRIVFTISTTVLKAAQQTIGHKHANYPEIYEFIEGYGEMILDNTTVNVNRGDYVFVEESKFHRVINLSKSSDLVFKCYFNGEIKRPHLQ